MKILGCDNIYVLYFSHCDRFKIPIFISSVYLHEINVERYGDRLNLNIQIFKHNDIYVNISKK